MADKDNSTAAAAKRAIAAKRKRVAAADDAAASDGEDDGNAHALLRKPKPKPYASGIYSYLRAVESEGASSRRPAADYMAAVQVDASPKMRAILVDWLVDVADKYDLDSDQTLYLTVSYIDRFLSAKPVTRHRLQLLGVSAMLLASKHEEFCLPNVEDLCYITDHSYTRQEVVQMERDILNIIKSEVGNPTTNTFLRTFIGYAQEDNDKYPNLQLEFLGSYLSELSMLHYGLLRCLPSRIAASAVFLTRLTLDPHTHPWSKKMQTLTGYTPSQLKSCVAAIHCMQINQKYPSMMAIRKKYKQDRFEGVSALLPPVEIPASYFKKLRK